MIVIDRFEGDVAICFDDGAPVNINRLELPVNAKEGSFLKKEGESYILLNEEEQAYRQKMRNRLDNLFKK